MRFLILIISLFLFIEYTTSIDFVKTDYNEKDIEFNIELDEVINATYNNTYILGQTCFSNPCTNCFRHPISGFCKCKHVCTNFLKSREKYYCKINCEKYYYKLINRIMNYILWD